MRFFEVDPTSFIKTGQELPEHGRGCWNRSGIGFDYRYAVAPPGTARIGTTAETSLAHWAVAVGCHEIQKRLVELGYPADVPQNKRGLFNEATKQAVIDFQAQNSDPDGGRPLVTDGTVGRSDARALFTPLILAAEREYGIPDNLLLGETYQESQLDPGAVGYFVYYPDFRGIDRGVSQINSESHPEVSWEDAFHPGFSFTWSAQRLRSYHDAYKKKYPKRPGTVLWDAAVCSHNNPSAGAQWARIGFAPTEQAASYVNAVKASRYGT